MHHDLCRRIHEPQLSYVDVNLTVLLRFVLRVYTRSAGRTNNFLLQVFSTVASVSSSFPSARVFWLLSSCLEWNLSLKPIHEFANSCRVRYRRTWYQPSEFTFIAGSVFYQQYHKVCHCNCSLPATTKSKQPACGSGGAACTVKFDSIRKSPGNDQRYGSQELMYLYNVRTVVLIWQFWWAVSSIFNIPLTNFLKL